MHPSLRRHDPDQVQRVLTGNDPQSQPARLPGAPRMPSSSPPGWQIASAACDRGSRVPGRGGCDCRQVPHWILVLPPQPGPAAVRLRSLAAGARPRRRQISALGIQNSTPIRKKRDSAGCRFEIGRRQPRRPLHAAMASFAVSTQPLIFSISGASPSRSRRRPSWVAANFRTSAQSSDGSASATAIAAR